MRRKMKKVMSSVAVLGITGSLFLTTVQADAAIPTGSRLKDLLSGSKIGFHPDGDQPTTIGTDYSIIKREGNAVEPSWYANWGGWTDRSTFNFSNFNSWVNTAKGDGLFVAAHMLFGNNNYLPDWLKNNSDYTADDLDALMSEMVNAVMDTNNNNAKVDMWNVVNEALDHDSGAYRPDSDCIWNKMGWEPDRSGLTGADQVNAYHPVYIRKAFEKVRAKTGRDLELRDYGVEFDPTSPKAKAFYQLVRHLLAENVPIDAVGFQMHTWSLNPDYKGFYDIPKIEETVKKFKALGLKVYFTEMDNGEGDLWDKDPASPSNQQKDFRQIITAGRESGVDGFFFWQVKDGNPAWRTNEHPNLFDEHYDPKPAYYGVQEALNNTDAFTFRALGTAGGEKVELLVDDQVVDSWYLSKGWADYSYPGYYGTHHIKLAFVNDGENRGQDMNARIDYLKVAGHVYQSEDYSNTGADYNTEYLWRNGYIDFGDISG